MLQNKHWMKKEKVNQVDRLEKKIDEIKEKLSRGKSSLREGRAVLEVSLSDLNKLLDLAYQINNYRLSCIWNLEKVAEDCKEYGEQNDKYREVIKLISGISNGVEHPIVKDINKITNEVLSLKPIENE